MSSCLLDPNKNCDNCGACTYCDLDATKKCDNCCLCLEATDYRGIQITEIILPKEIRYKRKKTVPKNNQ